MKKLLFLLAAALVAFSAHAKSPAAQSEECLSPSCKCTFCHCVQKLEYAFMDEPDSYNTYVFVVRLCHKGPEICGVASKPIVYNIKKDNKDVSDEVLVSWSVGIDPDFQGGQVNYTVTYKIDGVVKTKTGFFSYI